MERTDDEARLTAALSRQLAARRADLQAGATHVGWKAGAGDRERIGGLVSGYLTSATLLAPGSVYRPGPGESLYADAELAVEVGASASIARYAVALEIVDLGGTDSADEIVATNVFHRAVAFGPWSAQVPGRARASIRVNGAMRDEAEVAGDTRRRVTEVGRLLGLVGERLRAGDRIITGSIVQVPVAPADAVVAALDGLGAVELQIAQR